MRSKGATPPIKDIIMQLAMCNDNMERAATPLEKKYAVSCHTFLECVSHEFNAILLHGDAASRNAVMSIRPC